MRWIHRFFQLCLFTVVSQMPLVAEQSNLPHCDVHSSEEDCVMRGCSQENTPVEVPTGSSYLIQAQIQTSVDQIQTAVDQILSTSHNHQTFENTLGAWNSMSEEIQATSSILNSQIKGDFPEKILALESIREYQSFISAIYLHNAQLYEPLFSYAKKAVAEDTLRTPEQQQIIHLVAVHCEQFKEDMSREDQEILAALMRLNTKTRAQHAHQASRLPRFKTHSTDEDCVIPCTDVTVNVQGDSQGNASAGVSVSEKSADGKWSAEGHANVNRDSQGNVTTSGGASVNLNFNNNNN